MISLCGEPLKRRCTRKSHKILPTLNIMSVMHVSPFRLRSCHAYVQILFWDNALLLLQRAATLKVLLFIFSATRATWWQTLFEHNVFFLNIDFQQCRKRLIFSQSVFCYLRSKWFSHLVDILYISMAVPYWETKTLLLQFSNFHSCMFENGKKK